MIPQKGPSQPITPPRSEGNLKNQWMAAILETLQELPQMERDVFVLNRYRSIGVIEIAAALSISSACAEAMLSTATEKLMLRLNAIPVHCLAAD